MEPISVSRGGDLLRLSIVTETYPPEVNGVARTISRTIEGLVDNGHFVELIRPRQGAPDEANVSRNVLEMQVSGIPIPRYGHLRMGLPAMNRLLRQWRVDPPDLVHVVTEGPLGLSALLAALRLGIPVCSEFRTNFHSYCAHYGIGWLRRPLLGYLRWFHNRTRCTMVPTHGLAHELMGLGFKNLEVVARGVDTVLFDSTRRCDTLRDAWGASDDTCVVLNVGRLAWEKNLPVVLSSFEKIRRTRPDSKLVFVGDGPARGELEARCPDAVFAGIQKGEALARHYASGDLFLFPSVTETFGNVTLEAMASGLPVVAFHHAAAGELIDSGSNGVLAELGGVARFESLSVDLSKDRKAARAMGRRARQSVAALNWPSIVRDIERVYARCAPTARAQCVK